MRGLGILKRREGEREREKVSKHIKRNTRDDDDDDDVNSRRKAPLMNSINKRSVKPVAWTLSSIFHTISGFLSVFFC